MNPDIKLGLNVPSILPVGMFPSIETRFQLWDMEYVKKVLASKTRARDLFPADWIENQSPYNSCASHGLYNALSRAYFRRTGQRFKGNPHYLYAHINRGQDQGALLIEAMRAAMNVGVPTIEDAPDRDKIFLNQYTEDLKPRTLKAAECFEVRSKEAVLNALAAGFEVVIAVHVGDNFANYKTGIAKGDSGPGNHCVMVDDAWWDDSIQNYVFDSPNSWGTKLGDGGRWKLTWERHMQIPNQYHVFYAIPTTTQIPTKPIDFPEPTE